MRSCPVSRRQPLAVLGGAGALAATGLLLRREPGGTTAIPGTTDAVAAELDRAHRLLHAGSPRADAGSHRP